MGFFYPTGPPPPPPPGASHISGVWERLVRTVKRSLKEILGKETMNEEVLSTVFTEVERIANTRPLTPNSSCPRESEPLTPSHFLNLRPSTNIPPGVVDENDKFSRKKVAASTITGQSLLETLA